VESLDRVDPVALAALRRRARRLGSEGWIVALLILLLLATLHLMSSAVQNSDKLSRLYEPLLIANVGGLTVLVGLIGYNLWHTLRGYRRRTSGSRLTLRMVVIFVSLAVAPVGVVYYYSMQFLLHGIDSWFDVKIDEAMNQSLELSKASLALHRRERLRETRELMAALDLSNASSAVIGLGDARARSGAVELTLMNADGEVLGSSNVDPTDLVPVKPDEALLQQVRQGEDFSGLLPYGSDSQLHVRVLIHDPRGRQFLLQALYPLSENITRLSEAVQNDVNRYKELAYLREALKFSFSLTLFLVLLFSLFAAVWAAFFFARRLVAPVTHIAEATRAIAEGDYDTQLPVPRSHDELAFLVSSFNTMTRRIAQARDEAERSRELLQAQHAYLETVLQQLTSGVMTFDEEHRLRTANDTASRLLRIDLREHLGERFNDLAEAGPAVEQLLDRIREPLVKGEHGWQREVTIFHPEERKILLCRLTPLRGGGRLARGHLLVFDDITLLVQAQRNAAWGEVARRLAHEIKNPLTPIQLSAERLRRRYLKRMDPEDAAVLDKATHTIVQQVEAMKEMVNAFSEYAKPPRLARKPLHADRFLGEVLDLYASQREAGCLVVDLNAGDAHIEADPVRMRQVLHNLLKNALESVESVARPRIRVGSRVIERNDCLFVEVQVEDNGGGIAEDQLGRLFEPYVTTKTKGTGLGLAIVKKNIEEHGGSVWAENTGDGARFVFRLPVVDAGRSRPGADDAAGSETPLNQHGVE